MSFGLGKQIMQDITQIAHKIINSNAGNYRTETVIIKLFLCNTHEG